MRAKGYKCNNVKCYRCVGHSMCGELGDAALNCVDRIITRQTNADRIRAMSEEELGKFLLSCCDWNLLIGDVCSEDNCAECHEEISTCSGNCFPAVVKWLQQTVK